MPHRVPAHVPVELTRARTRWFRLSARIGVDGVSLAQAAPDELDGVLDVAFHLPGDPAPARCRARLAEEVVGSDGDERAERRGVQFLDLDESTRTRIESYVNERLGLKA